MKRKADLETTTSQPVQWGQDEDDFFIWSYNFNDAPERQYYDKNIVTMLYDKAREIVINVISNISEDCIRDKWVKGFRDMPTIRNDITYLLFLGYFSKYPDSGRLYSDILDAEYHKVSLIHNGNRFTTYVNHFFLWNGSERNRVSVENTVHGLRQKVLKILADKFYNIYGSQYTLYIAPEDDSESRIRKNRVIIQDNLFKKPYSSAKKNAKKLLDAIEKEMAYHHVDDSYDQSPSTNTQSPQSQRVMRYSAPPPPPPPTYIPVAPTYIPPPQYVPTPAPYIAQQQQQPTPYPQYVTSQQPSYVVPPQYVPQSFQYPYPYYPYYGAY